MTTEILKEPATVRPAAEARDSAPRGPAEHLLRPRL